MRVWERIEPEEELLIRCASPEIGEASRQRIRLLLEQELDEAYIVTQARAHGITGLVQAHVEDLAPEHAIQKTLSGMAHGITMRNLQHLREVVRIAGALEEEGIQILPFKGPMLTHLVYGNAAFRTYQDIDVLIPRPDLFRAKELLLGMGYRPLYNLTPREEHERIEAQVGYELERNETGLAHVIELHWSFLNTVHSFDLDPEAVFDRAERVTVGGRELLNVSPEDLLLYLCAHGAKHHWERLKWIGDVNALIRARTDLDWDTALDRAGELGGVRMVGLGVYLAAELLETPLPDWVRQSVYADAMIPRLAQKVLDSWLFREPDAPKIEGVDAFWFLVRTRERWRDSLPYVRHNAGLLVNPSQKDKEVVTLPDSLSGLYYLIRPLRVLKQRLF